MGGVSDAEIAPEFSHGDINTDYVEKSLSNGPVTLSMSQAAVLFLGGLVVIQLFSPFVSLLLLFLIGVLALLIAAILLVALPKREENTIRARFPRLKFTKNEEWNHEMTLIQQLEQFEEPLGATEFSRSTDPLVQLIIRDFVESWFNSVSNYDAFPVEIRSQLRNALICLEQRAQRIDVSKFLVLQVVPIITRHFSAYCAAEDTVLSETNHVGSSDLDLLIAKEFNSISKLNQFISLKSLDNELEKKAYARDRVSKFIEYLILDDELNSGPVFVLIREIITNVVLFPVLRRLSDSDFHNQTIVRLVSATLKDRTQVRELRDAIDKQYMNPHSKQYRSDFKGPLFDDRITPTMTHPAFQKYTKAIEKSNSLPSLKQLKYFIAVQISRTHNINSRSEKFIKYSKRLNVAKCLVDKRIQEIADLQPKRELHRRSRLQQTDLDDFISKLTLSQILSNPSSLSFFMEFMEQRSRTVLLQYWITVNSIRDPLEDPQNPDYEEEMASSTDLSGVEDVKLIFDQFFKQRLLRVDTETFREVEAFATDKEKNIDQYTKARKMILVLQLDVFHRMEKRDLPDFKNSDFFLKLLANETFEQSLVNEVDTIQDEAHEDELEDDLIKSDDERSFLELENALSNILSMSTPETEISSSKDSFPKTAELKNDLFGSEDNGFLNEKPLFDDGDAASETSLQQDEDMSGVDNDFFQVSHDVLNLKEAISKLEQDIQKLTEQNEMLDPLILKAELTNNTNELRLLRKSKSSFDREIESKELLKQQLIVQENENSLFGKTKVNINSWVNTQSSAGHYIVYVIEVERAASVDGKSSTSWIIGRRFSQFYHMHEALKREYPELENTAFPKKKLVLKFQQKPFLDERRSQLESYLRRLLEMPKVCQSKEFRKFLTADDYSFTSDINAENPTSTRFELKDAANKLYSGLSSSVDLMSSRTTSTDNLKLEDSIEELQAESEQAEEMRKELENYESERNRGQSFLKPITELFIELFPLSNANSWLRGRALIVILQKVLGNTIERYIKEQVSHMTTQEKMKEMVGILTNTLWPNGQFMRSGVPRTTQEKQQSKREARLLLEKLMIDMLSKVVGQAGSKNAAVRLHSMIQNDLLNLDLALEIMDKLFEAVFPEMKTQ